MSATSAYDRASGWRIILDDARATNEQMANDERLAGEEIPTARFFLWNPPALSLGFKQGML